VSILETLDMPWLLAAVLFSMFVIPLYGNFVPSRVSFLLAMRYYAGNWAYNVWLIRKDALAKLDKLKKNATTTRVQLGELLPDPAMVEVALSMSLAHRFMHLEGRPLLEALPRTVDRIEDYEWIDGEMFAGMIIGWNFGDGHLNNESLLNAIQPQCQFAPGEVRVLMVEAQPLFGPDDALEDRRRRGRRARRGRYPDRAAEGGAAVSDREVRRGVRARQRGLAPSRGGSRCRCHRVGPERARGRDRARARGSLGCGGRAGRRGRRRDAQRRAHVAWVRARPVLGRAPDGDPVAVLPRATARRARPRLALAARLGGAPRSTTGRR
jgi:hypothetical protein